MKLRQTRQSKQVLAGTDSFRVRDFCLEPITRPYCTDSYWDGGSRDYYRVINLDSGATFIPPAGVYPWNVKNDYTLTPGDVLIQTGICCGKPSPAYFYCRPEDLEKVKTWLGVNAPPVIGTNPLCGGDTPILPGSRYDTR